MLDYLNNLLDVQDLSHLEKNEEGKNSLLFAVAVNPANKPFLVSSIRKLIWVKQADPNGYIGAAIREVEDETKEEVFKLVVNTIYNVGSNLDRYNFSALTAKNLKKVLLKMEEDSFEQKDIFCHPKFDWPEFLSSGSITKENAVFDKFREWSESLDEGETPPSLKVYDCSIIAQPWVRPSELIIVPKNRSNFGTYGIISENKKIVFISNPLKAISILRK